MAHTKHMYKGKYGYPWCMTHYENTFMRDPSLQPDLFNSQSELEAFSRLDRAQNERKQFHFEVSANLRYLDESEIAEFEHAAVRHNLITHCTLLAELDYHRAHHARYRRKLAERWGRVRLGMAGAVVVGLWVLIFFAIRYLWGVFG